MHVRETINFSTYDGDPNFLDNSTLGKIYKSQNKFLSMKWEQYIGIYDRHLAPYLLAKKPVNLLEIGVQNGGSLETWKDYLPAGSKIWGIDINPLCNDLEFSDNITFIHGSGTDCELIKKNFSDIEFDIIIDDASHICSDVITSFELLFSKLKQGGIYIVEDCHTSYWERYKGGYRSSEATVEYFKKLVESIHYRYIEDKNAMTPEENVVYKVLNKDIASIMFYDSVIIVEKYLQRRSTGFRNYMTQGEAKVISREKASTVAIDCLPSTLFERIYK